MKILFMGSPDYAVPSLEALHQSKHEVVAVLTQADKPAGRGSRLKETPIKSYAIKNKIPVYTPKSCKTEESYELFNSLQFDLAIVIAYGQILPKKVLDLKPKMFINAHGSLLPKYRGASPLTAPLLNGDSKTGVTIQKMSLKVDAGDILLKESLPIEKTDTTGSLHDKLSILSASLLLKAADLIEANNISPIPQNEEEASLVGKLNKEMGHINWQDDAYQIERKVRAFNPWPGSYTFYKSEDKSIRIKIKEVEVIKTNSQAGKIIQSNKEDGIIIGTGKDAIRVLKLQREGKKEQNAAEFLNGMPISPGTIWE